MLLRVPFDVERGHLRIELISASAEVHALAAFTSRMFVLKRNKLWAMVKGFVCKSCERIRL